MASEAVRKLLGNDQTQISGRGYQFPDEPHTIHPLGEEKLDWLKRVKAVEMSREQWLSNPFWPIRSTAPVGFIANGDGWDHLAVALDPEMMMRMASERDPRPRRYFSVRLMCLTPDIGLPEDFATRLKMMVN